MEIGDEDVSSEDKKIGICGGEEVSDLGQMETAES